MSEQSTIKEKIIVELKKPKMYKVVLLNDDYTTMDFVIEVLVVVFHKSVSESTKIMLDVHHKGRGIVGVYTYDIASTKAARVVRMAEERGYPLNAVVEEE